MRYARDNQKAQGQEVEQNWVPLKVLDEDDPQCVHEKENLICKHKEQVINFDQVNPDYLNKLLTSYSNPSNEQQQQQSKTNTS